MDDQAPDHPSEVRGQQGPKGSLPEAEAQRRIGGGGFFAFTESRICIRAKANAETCVNATDSDFAPPPKVKSAQKQKRVTC
jgi:hypothetical protein